MKTSSTRFWRHWFLGVVMLAAWVVMPMAATSQTLPKKVPHRALLNANHCDGELEVEACLGVLEYQLGEYGDAVRIWQVLAAEGDVVAQRNLGLMYQRGRGVLRDRREAARWYTRAADQGDAGAQLALGALYQTGKGVPRDTETAALYYRRAVRGGSSRAAYRLALMHRLGIGVSIDERLWLRYLRIAAFRGMSDAQVELGRFFFRRKKDDGDLIRACAFFRFAADSAIEPLIRREAGDWLFRVQDDIDDEGLHNCRKTARDWRRTMTANGGRAQF